MKATTDLEALIRHLAGRDQANSGRETKQSVENNEPLIDLSAAGDQFFEEIRTKTRALFGQADDEERASTRQQAAGWSDQLSSPSPRRQSSVSSPGWRWFALLFAINMIVCSLAFWWLINRWDISASAQSERILAELHAILPAQPFEAPPAGKVVDPPAGFDHQSWRQFMADVRSIQTKLDLLARTNASNAAQDQRSSAKLPTGLVAPAANRPGNELSGPTVSQEISAIHRDLQDSEAATSRQIQEMRTILHELNTVVRRVLNRPQPSTGNNVALPLLGVAVQALINNLQHQTTQVRGEAVEQLVRLGPLARSALPALQHMVTREPDPNVRTAVETAINVISSN